MDALKTLILFNIAVLLVNTAIAALCQFYYRDRLYLLSLYLWIARVATMVLEGVLQKSSLQLVLGFSSYFACAMLLVRILRAATRLSFPMRRYSLAMGAGFVISVALSVTDAKFAWVALPAAIAIAHPMIDAALRTLFASGSRVQGFSKIYAFVLLVNGLHFLDYPFLRTDPNYALLGFSFALVILVALSLVLPAFITKNISDRYSSRLENEVLSRTRELIEANRHLKAMTSENKHLLSVVCHDIASPLATVVMGMDVIHDPDSPAPLDPHQEKIVGRVRKALGAITEILSYVRELQATREGKVRLQLTGVDLSEAVQESCSALAEPMATKKIQLKVECHTPHVRALADLATLKNQILSNLLSNAIKFSHPGGEIRISIREEGDRTALSISDSGIGMPQSIADQVFNPASATNRLGTSGEKGTGFGLPIAKACIEQYGAEIRCESRNQADHPNDHGTTFTVLFKRSQQAARAPLVQAASTA